MLTFLFTDIEGSTQRWADWGDAMSSAVRRHDDLMRSAIESNGGRVFKTVGDAFCAVFRLPSEGVMAAAEAQKALAHEDWSNVDGLHVRMALHTGVAEERDGDYFGPTLNRTARLLELAHGGQVVLSNATGELVRPAMPQRSELRDLGEHRLKDLVERERVWQLLVPGLPDRFPPLRSVGSIPNNLPRLLAPLVGRGDVVAHVEALVKERRLLTLVGTGGIGKTCIALQTGANLLESFADGVWFVDFALQHDGTLLAESVAAALSLRQNSERPALQTLIDYLKPKRALLVFDNCEHVVEAAAKIVDAVLRACPEVRLLATSREPLRISGEHVYRVPSLAVPSGEESRDAETAATYGAVGLFAQRAAAADAAFALTDDNAPIVVEICRRLDGIALAIELAAARISTLSPRQLLEKLNERFRVLTGGSRAALARQQTMQTLIDWSYDLLSLQEQRFFLRLAIFAGSWSLEAATAVCGDDGALDTLSALVDKSLVVAESVADGKRYRLLESTHEYARRRLIESGEHDVVARAHAHTYLALAQRRDAEFTQTPLRAWLESVEGELDNWRAALDWALEKRADVLLAQQLVGALRFVWIARAPNEGRRWVREALEGANDTTPLPIVARLELVAASLDIAGGRFGEAVASAQRALEKYRTAGDRRGAADAQRTAGDGLINQGLVAQGEPLLQAALAVYRALGDDRYAAVALGSLAAARRFAGDVSAARTLYAQALELCRGTGSEQSAALYLSNLAEVEFREGNVMAAVRIATDAVAVLRELKDQTSIAVSLNNLAAYLIAQNEYERARDCAREGLAVAMRERIEPLTACALQHLAAIAALRGSGESIRAARLIGFANARLSALHWQREFTEQTEYDRLVTALQDQVGAVELERLAAEGRAWSEERAAAQAFAV